MLELIYTRRTQPAPWAEVSDRELLLSVRAGDEAAFNELIGRKTKPLLQLVQRILNDTEEARDVVQVTFFKVWENRLKFDERWSPNTWIYRIASNLAIDHLRSRKSREKSDEPVRQHLLHLADGSADRDLSRVQHGEVAARNSGPSSSSRRSRASPPPRWRRCSSAASPRSATTCSTPAGICAGS